MRSGFSLVEMTVAMAITVVALAAVFTLIDPASTVFQVQPEVIDQHQRLRMSMDGITRDLMTAGAGLDKYIPAVLPRRRGLSNPDPSDTFFDDRISTLAVAAGFAETVVSDLPQSGLAVYVQPQPGCGVSSPLCGFSVNTLVVVFDQTGAYDTFRVSAIQIDPPALLRAGGTLSKSYAAGSPLVEVTSSTYWVRSQVSTGASDLMHYDGRVTDLPMADGVSALQFEYFGDPAPPALVRSLTSPHGPWTSYGPKPPAPEDDDPATPGYGAGENCAFVASGGLTVARPDMPDLGSAQPTLVRLPGSQLVDGPWCPDPSAPNRFDADVLRIRRVRVVLRVRPLRTFLHTPIAERSLAADVDLRNMSLPR